MSHIESIELVLSDLEALEAGAKRFEGQLVKQSTYRWFGKSVGDYPLPKGMTKEDLGKCDYAIKLPGVNYEVGVVKVEGGYRLAYDFYGYDRSEHDGHKLKAIFGDQLSKLRQAYAAEIAKKVAKRKGWRVKETTLPNGALKLQFAGM